MFQMPPSRVCDFVVVCKGCMECIPAPVETMPDSWVIAKCPLCLEKRRYLPSDIFGVVAWIGLRISYSETDPRKAASSMPNKHNASRRRHIPCMTASALSRQFLRPLAVKIA